MKITGLVRFPDILLVEPDAYHDERGYFYELYNETRYLNSIPALFVQDNHSFSKKGVLRGLHYQLLHPQGKLISVLSGEIFDVAVDIRRGSPTFGQCEGIVLSAENRRQLYLPEGFAHGFFVTGDHASVLYKCTDYYDPRDERGIRWDDPTLNIPWPTREPVLSAKDLALPLFKSIGNQELPNFESG